MLSVSATLWSGLSDRLVSRAGLSGLSAVRNGDSQVPVGPPGSDPASGGALDQAALQQVGLVDVLDGIARLAEGHGDRTYADRSPAELVYYEPEIVPVGPIQAEVVDALHIECGVRRLLVYLPIADDLGVVPHPLEEPIYDAGRTTAAARELHGAAFRDRDAEYLRVADHDLLEVLGPVVLEPLRDPEAVEQGLRKQALPGGRTDQREARQVHPDRACRGPLSEHDVHREVLHRGVEDLFDLPVQTMDLVDKQEVALLQRGQDRRHVPGPLQSRPAR